MTIAAVLKQKGHEVISVLPTAPAPEVVQVIASRRIGAVLVLDEAGALLGIVSERDIVKALATQGGAVLSNTAQDLMTRRVTTATPRTSVDQALEIMDAGYFRHLPVVDAGRLVGIISIRDLVKYRIMLHQHDVESLKAYVARQA